MTIIITFVFFAPSRKILERLVDVDLSDPSLPVNTSVIGHFTLLPSCLIRLIRNDFTGNLGYEIHAASEDCKQIYQKILNAGKDFGLRNAGYRALSSLNCEKGWFIDRSVPKYHLNLVSL